MIALQLQAEFSNEASNEPAFRNTFLSPVPQSEYEV